MKNLPPLPPPASNSFFNLDHVNEVEDIIGTPPSRLTKYGISVVGSAIFGLIFFSAFIAFPDTVSGTGKIATNQSLSEVISKAEGVVQNIYFNDGAQVRVGDTIMFISDNSLKLEQLKILEEKWYDLLGKEKYDVSDLYAFEIPPIPSLTQTVNAYRQAIEGYSALMRSDEFSNQIISDQNQISVYENRNELLRHKLSIVNDEKAILAKKYNRAQKLYEAGVLSEEEFEEFDMSDIAFEKQLNNLEMELNANEGIISNYKLSIGSREDEFGSSMLLRQNEVRNSIRQLIGNLQSWMSERVVLAPRSGILELRQEARLSTYLNSGRVLATVIPQSFNESYLVEGTISAYKSGSVHPGQKVRIDVANYPAAQYGYLRGTVKELSKLPAEDREKNEETYSLSINLSDAGKTSTGKTISLVYDQPVQFHVVTESRTLLKRLINQAAHAVDI